MFKTWTQDVSYPGQSTENSKGGVGTDSQDPSFGASGQKEESYINKTKVNILFNLDTWNSKLLRQSSIKLLPKLRTYSRAALTAFVAEAGLDVSTL